MGIKDELDAGVAAIFKTQWSSVNGTVIPDPADLRLSNDAKHFERATIFYADLASSTALVNGYIWSFAGEIYQTYLMCVARLIRANNGVITGYDGDRVMAVFIGDTQTSDAAKCALQTNWAVKNIINPAIAKQYKNGYMIEQRVGIDTGEVRAARIGVRGGNDLVWIGPAANYAAKMCSIGDKFSTWITEAAYNQLADWAKLSGGSPKVDMWEKRQWTAMNNKIIYGSTYWWALS